MYPSNIRGTFHLEMTWNSLLRYVKTWRSTGQNIWQQLLHITPNQRDQIDISPNKMPINLLQNASNFFFLITKVETVFLFFQLIYHLRWMFGNKIIGKKLTLQSQKQSLKIIWIISTFEELAVRKRQILPRNKKKMLLSFFICVFLVVNILLSDQLLEFFIISPNLLTTKPKTPSFYLYT